MSELSLVSLIRVIIFSCWGPGIVELGAIFGVDLDHFITLARPRMLIDQDEGGDCSLKRSLEVALGISGKGLDCTRRDNRRG